MVKVAVCVGNRLVRNTWGRFGAPKGFGICRGRSQSLQWFCLRVGVDRMAMLKYGINDIRLLYEGDVSFLRSL